MPSGNGVETPSGKHAGTENFPVASRLIARRLRRHVMAFYAFARAIDDIADSPELAPEDKLERLGRFEAGLLDPSADAPDKAAALARSLQATHVTQRHALDLIDAFRQDAVQGRYADWHDLMQYCDRSAAPVGRYLLDLHGEARGLYPLADALCNALQVLNHLQDCADDYRQLDRVYLPQDWLAAEGIEVTALAAPAASAGLRRALDRCLAATDALLHAARPLPLELASRRLALESAVILAIAERLSALLKRADPLAGRVRLDRRQDIAAACTGLWRQLAGRWA
ncbi:MAG: squalene synthase HpnC [Alphaproteobacteria bacterium]|nr:squalene synthase HpnC [Alphaproteobacteria bacterium]